MNHFCHDTPTTSRILSISADGGSFTIAFHTPWDAVRFALAAQTTLLTAPWPPALLDVQGAAPLVVQVPRAAADATDFLAVGRRRRRRIKSHGGAWRSLSVLQAVQGVLGSVKLSGSSHASSAADDWRTSSCRKEKSGSDGLQVSICRGICMFGGPAMCMRPGIQLGSL